MSRLSKRDREIIKILHEKDPMTDEFAALELETFAKYEVPESKDMLHEAIKVALKALTYKAAAEKLWEVIEQAGYEGKEVEIRRGGRLFKIREVAQ